MADKNYPVRDNECYFEREAIALESWDASNGFDMQIYREADEAASRRSGFMQSELDELNRSISVAIVDRFTPRQIRAQILANVYRWSKQGVWVTTYDEWRAIAESEDDGDLYSAMVGQDQ